MYLEDIREMTSIKKRLLDIAVQLQDDDVYTKEDAVEDIKKLIKYIDQSTKPL